MTEAFRWTVTLASLCGVMLNIHHRRECFAVWGVTNAAWCLIDFHYGIWSQSALQAIYCVLSLYGWAKWNPNNHRKTVEQK